MHFLIFYFKLTSAVRIKISGWDEKLRFSVMVGSTRNNNDSWAVIFKGFIIAGSIIPTIRCYSCWATGPSINQGLHSSCILQIVYSISKLIFIFRCFTFNNYETKNGIKLTYIRVGAIVSCLCGRGWSWSPTCLWFYRQNQQ